MVPPPPGPSAFPDWSSQRSRRAPDNCLSVDVSYPSCSNVGNDMFSCYPTADTVIDQNTWTRFIWNANLPQLTQLGFVDVYLYSADSLTIMSSWTHLHTGQGQLSSCVNDDWLGDSGLQFNGTDLTWRFLYVIVASGTTLTGAEPKGPVFRVLQTAPLNSVVSSSMASASSSSLAAASSSSLAAESSHTGSPNPTQGGPGSLQGNGSNNDTFPHWAIALLAVLGFLTFLGFILFGFFFFREVRRRQRRRSHGHRESIGSSSPMMAAVTPMSPDPTGASLAARRKTSLPHSGKAASSTTSRANSAGDNGPFSGAEAAAMADAFRNALRRPDFADRPVEEGESPDTVPSKDPDSEVLLSRELAEEGRDIRSVRSERGVKVETINEDDDDDITDRGHR